MTIELQAAFWGARQRYETLCEAFQQTAATFATEVALRTPDGDVELSWSDYASRVEEVARGLAGLGVGDGDTVATMLVNRPEFHVVDTASLHLGATPFSVYSTSTVEQIAYLFTNAQNRVVVTERQFLDVVLAAREIVSTLEQVIVVDGPADGAIDLDDLAPDEELDFERTWRMVEPSAIATLIYTSGTTGPPKGVMLTHANLVAAWEMSVDAVPLFGDLGRYISYLPAAHLADRVFSHYPAMVNGSSITCVADPREAVALLPQIQPTVWLAVPRIWEKLKDAIEASIDAGDNADEVRRAIEVGDESYLAAIRQRIGLDDSQMLVSGAAPIREDVLEFFAGLGLPICEGYGMTETAAVATLNRPGEQRFGTVGPPAPGVEVRLADDGEVLIRSAGVMAGYRSDPVKTAEAIDDEGWLHTGDIGTLDEDGYLSIVDRKKELIINAAGKNMSPANIEMRLKAASPLIGHAVAIGDRRPYNTALIVLDPDSLGLYAYKHGIEDFSVAGMSADGGVLAEIAAAVADANEHLSRVEQVKRFVILPDEWEPGSELVTPTLKLRRKPIAEIYEEEIEGMYAP